jgi:hypothetical protein
MVELTDAAKKHFAEWVKKELQSYKVVPADEGNENALIYNIVHNIIDGPGFDAYDYKPEQDAEIESWGLNEL